MTDSSGAPFTRNQKNARVRSLAGAEALPTVVAESGRVFATQPAAVFVFIFNDEEKVLLMRSPGSPGWRPVGGAVEAGETILEAARRETAEEVGELVDVRPLGVAHAWTYRYDGRVRQMIDVAWVMSYEGGEVVPGDDMAGSEWRWWVPGHVSDLLVSLPEGTDWLLQRAVAVFRTYSKTS